MLNSTAVLHVKWFTEWSEDPLPMSEVITSNFLFWLLVTLAGLLLTSIFNEPLQKLSFIRWIHVRLDQAKPYLTEILRVGLIISLTLQLLSDVFLAPDMEAKPIWIHLLLGLAIIGMLHQKLLRMAAVMLAILYIYAIAEYGWLHGLDYIFYLGIIYYLSVYKTKAQETATPALYFFTGLSLAWVALEKMTIPDMTYRVVVEHGIPTFGFSVENFILIAAFIELGLAWTFIVGILNRFVSIIVTLVFITTTMVFGYIEIIGHTPIHAILIMFLIQGEGTFKTPFQFHHAPLLRYTFVLVNFCVLVFGLMALYIFVGNL